jgi:predicted metalloprotease
MRWEDMRRSDNVEDDRDSTGGGGGRRAGGLGIVGIVIVVLVSWALGKNPLEVLTLLTQQQPGPDVSQQAPAPAAPANDKDTDFVRAVLGDTEDTWKDLLSKRGQAYHDPHLVLFTRAVDSACGFTSAAVGPFYCPGDRKVYLDLGFFRELSQRFGAPGDFARAYVIAHEVGHHVQNELGVSNAVDRRRAHMSESQGNALSVRVELQADCYAGVWGHYAQQRRLVDFSDVKAALTAATAIGDDRLQMQSQGYIAPESFTHGTSEQRVQWFNRGLSGGDPQACDTFKAS